MPLSMSASAACHKVGQKALKYGIPLYISFVEPFCPSMRLECTKCERASTTINLKGIEDSIFLARLSGSKWIGRMYQKWWADSLYILRKEKTNKLKGATPFETDFFKRQGFSRPMPWILFKFQTNQTKQAGFVKASLATSDWWLSYCSSRLTSNKKYLVNY